MNLFKLMRRCFGPDARDAISPKKTNVNATNSKSARKTINFEHDFAYATVDLIKFIENKVLQVNKIKETKKSILERDEKFQDISCQSVHLLYKFIFRGIQSCIFSQDFLDEIIDNEEYSVVFQSLTGDVITKLLNILPEGLQQITFDGCNGLTNETIQGLKSKFPFLLGIKIMNCDDLSIEYLIDVTQRIKKLKYLEYWNSDSEFNLKEITEENVDNLFNSFGAEKQDDNRIKWIGSYFDDNQIADLPTQCMYIFAAFLNELKYVNINCQTLSASEVKRFKNHLSGVNTANSHVRVLCPDLNASKVM